MSSWFLPSKLLRLGPFLGPTGRDDVDRVENMVLYEPEMTLFCCCCCCTDVCTIILFSLFLFDIWPCFMYFGRCTFAWVSSVALFYHGWRRREMFNECFLRAPLWPLKRGDNFLVLIFIFLAQMTKKKETNVGLGVWKKINQTFFFYFIVALIENKLSLLFFNINCTKKERKKEKIGQDFFVQLDCCLTFFVNSCPNRWINNLRLRIFYKPTLWFPFALYGLLDMGIVISLIVN